MNGSSKPCVRVSQHTAPEYSGCCHQHSLTRYQDRPLGKCTIGATGFHYVRGRVSKALAFIEYLSHPEYPPRVSLSWALPQALASRGILLPLACGLAACSSFLESVRGVTSFPRLMGS